MASERESRHEDSLVRGAPLRRRIHRDFESELRTLNESLLSMAGRVEQMIGQAVRALFAKDANIAQAVREADRLVNAAEIRIDGLVLKILARRQPMGSDLRFLTRALKMVTDIERIGDLAVNLGKQAIDLAELSPHDATVHPAIERMAEVVRAMIGDALDAFVERDAEGAREVIERDDEVDELHDQVYEDVLAQMIAHPEMLPVGIRVQECAMYLERMGDHACNLAEQVVFLVHAKDIRHPPEPGA
ncbi:phosphate signaling complex protein PhoU [Pseudenhygromyxa sp. WMMC2535]|uniref:phosphate signaling complex protein PhoU n=1 Tax=Pseudenhygromyxa sp. WMMC2535 TaxID=2712867 RepID=UPI001555F639|nr:phosphate signaling complex protein PhoU [Pseudenhygromyxa sp. WMMC2535]NVB42327.1 phosphate signaling complex protein PhoU [Pseudenhygromyxa sp. WMMC2535]